MVGTAAGFLNIGSRQPPPRHVALRYHKQRLRIFNRHACEARALGFALTDCLELAIVLGRS